jgi:hypothetical protein
MCKAVILVVLISVALCLVAVRINTINIIYIVSGFGICILSFVFVFCQETVDTKAVADVLYISRHKPASRKKSEMLDISCINILLRIKRIRGH